VKTISAVAKNSMLTSLLIDSIALNGGGEDVGNVPVVTVPEHPMLEHACRALVSKFIEMVFLPFRWLSKSINGCAVS
jgi:hypothetical protein